MGDRSGDAGALLGMDGFVVLSQVEEDGELDVLLETTAAVAGPGASGPIVSRTTAQAHAR